MGAPTATLLALLLASAPASAHDWFTDLTNRYGHSCCNGEDCGRTTMGRTIDDREGVMVRSECRPIPWDRVLDTPSPDGEAYVCAGGLKDRWQTFPKEATLPPAIVCVILPGSV